MFVVLRRFSVLMTMYAEIYILKAKKPMSIQLCVYGMVVGAFIAAFADLAFDLQGYSYLMLTNIFGTANAISIKDKITGSV
jgi:solute carrier family 35 protein